jgi:hypothetical protein
MPTTPTLLAVSLMLLAVAMPLHAAQADHKGSAKVAKVHRTDTRSAPPGCRHGGGFIFSTILEPGVLLCPSEPPRQVNR